MNELGQYSELTGIDQHLWSFRFYFYAPLMRVANCKWYVAPKGNFSIRFMTANDDWLDENEWLNFVSYFWKIYLCAIADEDVGKKMDSGEDELE